MVVGELIALDYTRPYFIWVVRSTPMPLFTMMVTVLNQHPRGRWTSFCAPTWRSQAAIVAGFLSLVPSPVCCMISMEDSASEFRAVILTDKEWDELGLEAVFP